MSTGASSPSAAPTVLTKCWSLKFGRPQFAARQISRQRGIERGRCLRVRASDDNGSGDRADQKPFGYTRKDVILLGGGIIGFGYALYYGLQAAGVDALVAGNFVQLFVFLGIGVGYISTYLFRVANKEMTYVKQLEDYEEAVMKKRLEEMPETERERLLEEIEQEKQQKAK
ncbi:g11852 [Coccomyxa elongata]